MPNHALVPHATRAVELHRARHWLRHAVLALLSASLVACAVHSPRAPLHGADVERMSTLIPALLEEHRCAGVGIGVLRAGEVVWTGYFGEAAPGRPTSPATVFNTASVAKTITAETLLALDAKG